MIIGAVPDPTHWARWPEAKALLEPARVRGEFPSVIEPDEALWAVMDGDELIAVATAWLGDGLVEVKLLGGKDHPRWLGDLDRTIGNAAAKAGAKRMVGFGRLGWTKALHRLGWTRLRKIEDHWIFVREL